MPCGGAGSVEEEEEEKALFASIIVVERMWEVERVRGIERPI
jgi:hypothetical protein